MGINELKKRGLIYLNLARFGWIPRLEIRGSCVTSVTVDDRHHGPIWVGWLRPNERRRSLIVFFIPREFISPWEYENETIPF
jgi:hypothetical protein